MPSTQEDIAALLKRAAEYEQAAERNPTERKLNLWFAAHLLAKAESLRRLANNQREPPRRT